MLAGYYNGNPIDLVSVFEAVGRFSKKKVSRGEVREIENLACPGAGSCAGLFTANSMNGLAEALGIALRGNGTIPAVFSEWLRLAKMSGRSVVELVKKRIKPKDIISRDSFHNAIAVDLALGGSTNTVLHLIALAQNFGISVG